MLALRVNKQKLSLQDIDKPYNPEETLVGVLLSGICNTDLEIARGYAGFNGTIGHEFVGLVEKTGKRVVGEINAGCGKCERCRDGDPRHCATRTVLGIVGRDGAHAEFLQLPAINLVEVPDGVGEVDVAFVVDAGGGLIGAGHSDAHEVHGRLQE